MVASVAGVAAVHLVRRGISVARDRFASSAENPAFMAKLQHDAELYDNTPGAGIEPHHMLPVFLTFIAIVLITISISYTVGDVMATLAMIESPSSVAIIEPKAPAYNDEPDAPLEKEPLNPDETDVEVTVVHTKMITAKLTTTMTHLQRVGGFFSRWRGLPYAFGYTIFHSMGHIAMMALLGDSIFMHVLTFVLTSLLLSQVHMMWTHSMIAKPINGRSIARMVARKDCKLLLMPVLIHAFTQQALIWSPAYLGVALGLHDLTQDDMIKAVNENDSQMLLSVAGRALLVGVWALLHVIVLVLPASATLTRIEAALLPEDRETIVPFDRDAVLGDYDVSVAADRREIVNQTWKSFNWNARLRVIKLYVKMYLLQTSVWFVGLHLMVAELYVIGGEKLGALFTSVIAELKLAMIESQQSSS